jgi:hypothetical protein
MAQTLTVHKLGVCMRVAFVAVISTLIRRRSARCARAVSGHAAAPPSPAMNSRRRISPLYGNSLPRPGAPENGSHLGSRRNSFDLFLQRERRLLARLCRVEQCNKSAAIWGTLVVIVM